MDLRALRKNSGVSRKRFCMLLGVSLRALHYWENGDRILPTARITRFAGLCGVSVDQVLKAVGETVGAHG